MCDINWWAMSVLIGLVTLGLIITIRVVLAVLQGIGERWIN